MCWHSQFKDLNGTVDTDGVTYASLVLNNNTLIYFRVTDQNCQTSAPGFKYCGLIGVDINGFKPPNIAGKDIYRFNVLPNQITPNGVSGDYVWDLPCVQPPNTGWNDSNNYGYGCTALYLTQ